MGIDCPPGPLDARGPVSISEMSGNLAVSTASIVRMRVSKTTWSSEATWTSFLSG